MSTVTYKFDLSNPEDACEYQVVLQAGNMYAALCSITGHGTGESEDGLNFRNLLKYNDLDRHIALAVKLRGLKLSEGEKQVISDICYELVDNLEDKYYTTINDYGINLDLGE